MCCDIEQWSDGSSDCVLYASGEVIANSYEGGADVFQSMTFTSGNFNYTLEEFVENVKETMVDEGCSAECVDATLTANATLFEAVATECGCPTYMLRYNMAQTLNLESSDDTNVSSNSSSLDASPDSSDATNATDDSNASNATNASNDTTSSGNSTNGTNGTSAATKAKEEEEKGSKTPFIIGGGVGLVALIGGVVYCKKS